MKAHYRTKPLVSSLSLILGIGCATPNLENYVRNHTPAEVKRLQEYDAKNRLEEVVSRPSEPDKENFVRRTLYFEASIEEEVKSVRVGNMYYSIGPEDLANLQRLAVYVNEGKGFDADTATFSGKFDRNKEGHVRSLKSILESIDNEFTGKISHEMTTDFVDQKAKEYQRQAWLEDGTLIKNKLGYIARIEEHFQVERTAAYRAFSGKIVKKEERLVVEPNEGLEAFTGDLNVLLAETYGAFDANGNKDITPEEVQNLLRKLQEGNNPFENGVLED